MYVNLSVVNKKVVGEHRIFSELVRCRFRGAHQKLEALWKSVGHGNHVTITCTPGVDSFGGILFNSTDITLHHRLTQATT